MNQQTSQNRVLFKTLCTSHFIFFMYDTTQLDTFRQVQLFIQNMRYPEVQCFLLGTKADMVQERRVEIREAEDLAAQFDLSFIEISSKDSLNMGLLWRILMIKVQFLFDVKGLPSSLPVSQSASRSVSPTPSASSSLMTNSDNQQHAFVQPDDTRPTTTEHHAIPALQRSKSPLSIPNLPLRANETHSTMDQVTNQFNSMFLSTPISHRKV